MRIQPKGNRMKLVCRTTVSTLTEDGDFIAAGTPVDVLYPTPTEKGHENPGTMTCRAHCHVFVDDIPEDLSGWKGNVGLSIYITVPVEHLEYVSLETL